MAVHNDTGKKGEELACAYLRKNGYEILHTNWRFKHWELDIIAVKNSLIHIVEVKTRKCRPENFPEQLVSKSKIRFLIEAGAEFMNLNQEYKNVQFDVLGIMIDHNLISYVLIEDVYIW